MDFLDYREKLGLGFCDEEKFQYFLVRVFNVLHNVVGECDVEPYYAFCMQTGSVIDPTTYYSPNNRFRHCVKIITNHNTCIADFLSYYVTFVNVLKEAPYAAFDKSKAKETLVSALDAAHIQFEIFNDSDGIFVFPRGVKEFDDALVSQPLEWLSAYPQAQKTFVIALRQYSDGVYIRDVADNLRKALEAFLQEFLGNTKNLETNKNEICKYLGEQGVDAGISGLFQPLINAYKNINDRIAKHNDAVDKKLLEFLLYQTGLLIRMVIVVNAEGDSNEA